MSRRNVSRVLISARMGAAIWASVPDRSRSGSRVASSLMGRADSSAIGRPATVTDRAMGLSRVPWQDGQATSRMKPSNCSRPVSALRLGVPPLDERDRTLERGVVGPFPAPGGGEAHVHGLGVAVQQGVLGRGRELGPGGVHAEAQGLPERLDEPGEVVAGRAAVPRADGAVGQGLVRVGDDQLRIDFHPGPQAGAIRARPPRRVERERPRLQLIERQIIIQARQMLRIHPLPVRVILSQVHEIQQHHATGEGQGGLDGVGQPAAGRRA